MGKKIALITTVFLVSLAFFLSHAQETEPKDSKLHFGLYFSPDNCFRKLTSDSSESNRMMKKWRDVHEKPRIGYSAGLSMLINLNERIDMESAVLFSEKGEKINSMVLYLGENSDPRLDGLYDTFQLSAVGFDYKYHYVEVPVKINYTFIDDVLKIFVSIGFSTGFFLNHKVTAYQYFSADRVDKTTSKNTYYDFNPLNFSVLLGMGLYYKINKVLSLKIEPVYKMAINSMFDSPIKSYPYSYGLGMGLYYSFNN